MQLIDTTNGQSSALATGYARSAYSRLASGMSRPANKTTAFRDGIDTYLIRISLPEDPTFDRVTLINANPYRIGYAINEIVGDTYYPTVYWYGGTPPYVVKLVYQSVDGTVKNYDVTGMSVNVNPNLTDGTGDIVLAGAPREYIMTRIMDEDDWWADDLETADLVSDEQINYQKRQNAIGLQITDSQTPPRVLFFPFSPDPEYSADGTTPSGVYAMYPQGRFGPPSWCYPTVHWNITSPVIYGHIFGTEPATVHIPGTTTALDGETTYWLDEDFTLDAINHVPDVNPALPIYARFIATDTLHYHTTIVQRSLEILTATQLIDDVAIWRSDSLYYISDNPPSTPDRARNPAGILTYTGDKFAIILFHARISGNPALDAIAKAMGPYGSYLYQSGAAHVNSASGNPFVYTPIGNCVVNQIEPYFFVLHKDDTYTKITDRNQWSYPYDESTSYAVVAELEITGKGAIGLTVDVAGNNNWTSATHTVDCGIAYGYYKATGSGGAVCGGEATVVQHMVRTGSGGAVCAGTGTGIQYVGFENTEGGAVCGGTGTASYGKVLTGSGGAVCGGAATRPILGKIFTGSGGAVCGGKASVIKSVHITGSGGAVCGGTASSSATYLFNGAGGAVCGGTASSSLSKKYYRTGSGGAVCGGSATSQFVQNRSFTGSGGAVCGGTATTSVYISPVKTVTVTVGFTRNLVYGEKIKEVITVSRNPITSGYMVYSPDIETVLNAGTHLFTATFVSTDSKWLGSQAGVYLTVEKAPVSIRFFGGSLDQTYTGDALIPLAQVYTIGDQWLPTVSVTYNFGPGVVPKNAGLYQFLCEVSDPNYEGVIDDEFRISKHPLTVTAYSTSRTYGFQTSGELTAYISGYPVNGARDVVGKASVTSTGGVGSNAGTYPIVPTQGTLSSDNYSFTFINGILTINKATPVCNWNAPASIMSGTALSGTQLNATANISGVFNYNPASGTVLGIGTHTLSCTFMPGPSYAANYVSVYLSVYIVVVATKIPITYTISDWAGWTKNRVRFSGATSGYYTITQVGSLTGLTVVIDSVNGNLANKIGMTLDAIAAARCYQPAGYYRVADRGDATNYVDLFFSSWFPLVGIPGQTSIGECAADPVPPPGSPPSVYQWYPIFQIGCGLVYVFPTYNTAYSIAFPEPHSIYNTTRYSDGELQWTPATIYGNGRAFKMCSAYLYPDPGIGHSLPDINRWLGTSFTPIDLGWFGAYAAEYIHIADVYEYK